MNHTIQERFSGKNLLVVSTGSVQQRFIFQKLKRLGVHIIALDRQKNWADPYVDTWILVDPHNHSESLRRVRHYIRNYPRVLPDGVIAFSDEGVLLAAKLSEECKLTGNTFDTALSTCDKYRTQEILKNSGLPFIRQQLLTSTKDLAAAIHEIGFPAVIKPVYGSASQYVVYVTNRSEAEEAYEYVFKNCTPDKDPLFRYNQRKFLYQEFVDGYEFSLESYSQHNVPHIVGIHEKMAKDLPFFLETGDYVPPRLHEDKQDELTELAKAALIVLGVRNSLAQVEIKLTKAGPKIIEVASRMSGHYTYDTIDKVYDFDLIEAGCDIAFGMNVISKPKNPRKYIMAKFFISKTSGVINTIRGFEDLKKREGVLDFFLSKEIGDMVFIPPEGYEHMGWVLVEGQSYSEVESTMEDIFENIRIEISPFKSYSSVGRTSRKNPSSAALLTKKGFGGSTKIEKIRRILKEDLHNLHIGIACNIFAGKNAVEADLMSVGKNIETALRKRGYRVTFFDFNNLPKAFADLRTSDVDLVFNVCERINGSSLLEPHAAAVLDILQIPYTGSNPFTLGLCIDKIRVKKLLSYHNIPTPRWDYAYSLEDKIREDLSYPLIVKPANTDNSIGITNDSVVSNKKELKRELQKVIGKLKRPALIEEYIEGDEYDVSILGNDSDDLQVLPLTRSIFRNMPKGYWHIYPFESKWSNDPAYTKGIALQRPPKNVDKKLLSLISEIALDTYNILDCHDYGRVEIRVDDEDNPYLLELNPNPSINKGDSTPNVAKLMGMDYADFLEEIMKMAIKRYKNKPLYDHLQANMM